MSTSKGTAKVTLPNDNQILVTREFNAPKHLVWRTLTEPELVKRWWGAEMGEVTLVEIDLRVGSAWRHVMTAHGEEVAFHGEFHEIVPNERIVQTEIYEGASDGSGADEAGLNTTTLDEVDGRTTMSVLSEYSSKQVRDIVIESGMEVGMQKSYDALEEVAVSLPA